MIYLGTDIVYVPRIEKIIKDKGIRFLKHVFTDLEQRICNDKSPPSIHYSGKYAAKEAIKKAYSLSWDASSEKAANLYSKAISGWINTQVI